MKRKGKKAVEIVTPLVRTVKQPYVDFRKDSVVPDWDAVPGVSQHATRVVRGSPPRGSGDLGNAVIPAGRPKI